MRKLRLVFRLLVVCSALLTGPTTFGSLIAETKPDDVLALRNIQYSQRSERVSFTVLNKSSNPILAYSLRFTWTFPGGKSFESLHAKDLTGSLSQVGRVSVSNSEILIGPIEPGRADRWDLSVGFRMKEGQPDKLTVVPTVVVFADNRVVGDQGQAEQLFFVPHRRVRDDYGRLIDQVRALATGTTDKRAALLALRLQFDASASALSLESRRRPIVEQALGTVQASHADAASELKKAVDHIDNGRLDHSQAIANLIQVLERYHAAFAEHSSGK